MRTIALIRFTSFTLMLAHIVLITLTHAATTPRPVGTIVDFTVNYPRHASRDRRHGRPLHGRRHLGEAGPGQTALSPGTSSTSTPPRCRTRSATPALDRRGLSPLDRLGGVLVDSVWRGALRRPVYRIALPLIFSRHSSGRRCPRRRPDVTTVTVRAADQRTGAQAGQFFNWRFLDGPGWTRANPYSLSAAPTDDTLRITVKHLGDGSTASRTCRSAPRSSSRTVWSHAPRRAHRPKVLLMGAGIRITPMRAPSRGASAGRRRRDRPPPDRHPRRPRPRRRDRPARRRARRPLCGGGGHRVPGRDTWLPAQAAHLSDVEASSTSFPTPPTARSTSAARRPGWTPPKSPPRPPACRPPPSTSSTSPTGTSTMRRITIWLMSTLSALVLLFQLPDLDQRQDEGRSPDARPGVVVLGVDRVLDRRVHGRRLVRRLDHVRRPGRRTTRRPAATRRRRTARPRTAPRATPRRPVRAAAGPAARSRATRS